MWTFRQKYIVGHLKGVSAQNRDSGVIIVKLIPQKRIKLPYLYRVGEKEMPQSALVIYC